MIKNKNKQFSLEPKGQWSLKLVCSQVCSHNDPGMTLTYFTARSNLVPYVFVWEKSKVMNFFRNHCILWYKVGRCSQLKEYIKLHECQRSRSFTDVGPNHSESKLLNRFSSISTWPIKAKFYVEPPWDERTKDCSNCLGHMTKMATMSIYGKILKKSSPLESKGQWPWKLVCSIVYSSTTKSV